MAAMSSSPRARSSSPKDGSPSFPDEAAKIKKIHEASGQGERDDMDEFEVIKKEGGETVIDVAEVEMKDITWDPEWESPAESWTVKRWGRTKFGLCNNDLDELAKWEDSAIVEEVKQRFIRFTSETGLLSEMNFHKVIGVTNKLHATLLYNTLLRDQEGNKAGLQIDCILQRLLLATPEAQLGLIFSMCDEKGSGEIGQPCLKKFLDWSANINKLKVTNEEMERMASVIFSSCNPANKDKINVEDFKSLLAMSNRLGITHYLKFPVGTASDFKHTVMMSKKPGTESLKSTSSQFLGAAHVDSVSGIQKSPRAAGLSGGGIAKSPTSDPSHAITARSASGRLMMAGHKVSPALAELDEQEEMAVGIRKEQCVCLRDHAAHTVRKFQYFCSTYWLDMLIITIWAAATISLFFYKFFQYKNLPEFGPLGYGICFAKGGAETLKLNFALILLPVCTRTVTYLRKHLGFAPGVDRRVHFHRLLGGAIVAGVFIHGGSHILFNFRNLSDPSKEQAIIRDVPWGLVNGREAKYYFELFKLPVGISGVVMAFTMIVAIPLASRRWRGALTKFLPSNLGFLGSFNTFWLTHHLLLVNYVLIVWHGTRRSWGEYPTTSSWKYVIGPVLLYAWERFMNFYSGYISLSQVEVVKAVMHPGKVLSLHMVRPPGFQYKSGMYIYLHCPTLSKYERHPFTMTSCPFDDEIVVHVKNAGDWTGALHETFAKCLEVGKNETTVHLQYPDGRKVARLYKTTTKDTEQVEGSHTNAILAKGGSHDGVPPVTLQIGARLYPKILLDGPYGAPSQEYNRYRVVVLVGAGIGITPFASITNELVSRIRIKQLDAYCCDVDDGESAPAPKPLKSAASEAHLKKAVRKGRDSKGYNTKKVYVIWATRDQASLTWFDNIYNLSAFDHKGVVELHRYLTWVPQDAGSAMLKLGQSLAHAQSGIDPVSGMQTRVATHFGRPNWNSILSKLEQTHQNERVGIFFCGPEVMANAISAAAQKQTTAENSRTRFDFRQERF